MSLTVREFRELVAKYNNFVAESNIKAIKKQRLGFSFKECFSKKSDIIASLLVSSILEANEPLLESSYVRLPEWMGKTSFDLLIAKMSLHAGYNF